MIVVITTLQLGKLLQQQGIQAISRNKEFKKLYAWLEKHHCTLQPTFPGIEEESMQVYFALQSPSETSDEDLAELRQLPGIEGAYRKAAEEPPA